MDFSSTRRTIKDIMKTTSKITLFTVSHLFIYLFTTEIYTIESLEPVSQNYGKMMNIVYYNRSFLLSCKNKSIFVLT